MSKVEETLPMGTPKFSEDGTRMSVDMTGTYKWQLKFNLEGPASFKREVEVTTEISRSGLRSELESHAASSESASSKSRERGLDIKKINVGVKKESSQGFERQAANELNSTEEGKGEVRTHEFKQLEYNIPEGESRKVYQLVFTAPGIYMALHSYSFEELPIEEVIFRADCELGSGDDSAATAAFAQLLQCMADTTPEKENREEWESIRKKCTELLYGLTGATTDERLADFWRFLSGISPRKANMDEWAAIRKECAKKYATPKQHLFAMLDLFSRTAPRKDNIVEWKRIAKLCSELKITLI